MLWINTITNGQIPSVKRNSKIYVKYCLCYYFVPYKSLKKNQCQQNLPKMRKKLCFKFSICHSIVSMDHILYIFEDMPLECFYKVSLSIKYFCQKKRPWLHRIRTFGNFIKQNILILNFLIQIQLWQFKSLQKHKTYKLLLTAWEFGIHRSLG